MDRHHTPLPPPPWRPQHTPAAPGQPPAWGPPAAPGQPPAWGPPPVPPPPEPALDRVAPETGRDWWPYAVFGGVTLLIACFTVLIVLLGRG